MSNKQHVTIYDTDKYLALVGQVSGMVSVGDFVVSNSDLILSGVGLELTIHDQKIDAPTIVKWDSTHSSVYNTSGDWDSVYSWVNSDSATNNTTYNRNTFVNVSGDVVDGQLDVLSGMNVHQSLTAHGDMWVKGDLRVDGNAYLSAGASGTINVGDTDTDVVVFHADVDSDITPDDDVSYNLGSSNRRWLAVHTKDSHTTGVLNVSGDSTLHGDLTVSGDTTIGGNVVLSGMLDVDDATTINDTLDVSGDGTLHSDLVVSGDTTIGGNTVLSGTLDVDDATTINDTLDVELKTTLHSDLTVSGASTIGGNTVLSGTLDVDDATTINDTLDVELDTTLHSDLTVSGASTIGGNTVLSGTLDVDDAATINDTLDVELKTTLHSDLTVSGDTIVGKGLTVSGNTVLSGTLDVDDATTINDTLDVELDTTLHSDLTVSGASTIGGNTVLSGTLDVDDATTINDTLDVELKTTLHSDLVVSGDTTVGGNTVLSGTISAGGVGTFESDVWIKGDLRVDGNAYLSAGANGVINVGDTNTDNVVFHADVDSSIKPDDNITHDLGSSTQQWRELFVQDVSATGDVDITGNIFVNGNTVLSGTLDVDDAATINDTLDVELDTTLHSDLVVSGDTIVGKGLTVSGNTVLSGTLDVDDATTINDTLDVELDTTLHSDLTVSGASTIGGNTTLSGTLDVDDAVTINDTLDVELDATLHSDLIVSGASTIGGNTTLSGTLDVDDAVTINDTLDVELDTTLRGDLTVSGASTIGGNVVLSGTLDVDDAVTINDTLDVELDTTLRGDLTVSGASTIGGNVVLSGTLDVDDATTINDTLDVELDTTLKSDLVVSGATTVGGNVVLSGTLDVDDATTINDTLDVSGDGTFESDVWIKGDLRVDGNAYLSAGASGTINVGDTNTDNVVFHADVDSSIKPDDNIAFDLGSSTQQWRELFVQDVSATGDVYWSGGSSITSNSVHSSVYNTSANWDNVYNYVQTKSGAHGFATLAYDAYNNKLTLDPDLVPDISITETYVATSNADVEIVCDNENIQRGDVITVTNPPHTLIAVTDSPTGKHTQIGSGQNVTDTFAGFTKLSFHTDYVFSVNGKNGLYITLNPDDLDDTQTAHKFVSQDEINKLHSVYTFVNGDSATNNSSYNEFTYVNAAGDVMTGGLKLENTLDVHDTATFHDQISAIANTSLSSLDVYDTATFHDQISAIANTSLSSLDVYDTATFHDHLQVSGTTTLSGQALLNNTLSVTGDSTFESDVWIKGDLRVDGNAYLSAGTNGTINVGDTNTDNVVFHADVDSSVEPNITDVYDIGSQQQRWRAVHSVSGYFDELDLEDLNVYGVTTLSGKSEHRGPGVIIKGTPTGIVDMDPFGFDDLGSTPREDYLVPDVDITGDVVVHGSVSADEAHIVSLTASRFRAEYQELIVNEGDLQLRDGNFRQRGGNIMIEGDIVHIDDDNTLIRFEQDSIQFIAHDLKMIQLNENPIEQDMIIIGDPGDAIDIKIQNPTDPYTFYVHGETGYVGIGTKTPQEKLHVQHGQVQLADGENDGALMIPTGTTGQRVDKSGSIRYNTDTKKYEGYRSETESWIAFTETGDQDGDTTIDYDAGSYPNSDRIAVYTAGCSAMMVHPNQTVSFAGDIEFDNITVYDSNNITGPISATSEFIYLKINGKDRAIRLWTTPLDTEEDIETIHGESVAWIDDTCAHGIGGNLPVQTISAEPVLRDAPTEKIGKDTDGDFIIDAKDDDDDNDGVLDWMDISPQGPGSERAGERDHDGDNIMDQHDPDSFRYTNHWNDAAAPYETYELLGTNWDNLTGSDK